MRTSARAHYTKRHGKRRGSVSSIGPSSEQIVFTGEGLMLVTVIPFPKQNTSFYPFQVCTIQVESVFEWTDGSAVQFTNSQQIHNKDAHKCARALP